MNRAERNKQIREDFQSLQKRGWKVEDICNFLSEKAYPVRLSAIRIYDIVYREQSEPDKPDPDQVDLFPNAK